MFVATDRRREQLTGSMGRGADAVGNLFGALEMRCLVTLFFAPRHFYG
jgi:hypothetical protein